MTGFGRSAGRLGDRSQLTIVARSVNHRFLDVSVRLPESLWELEPIVRSLANEAFTRGKLDVSVRAQRVKEAESRVTINRKVAEVLVPQLRALGDELGISEPLRATDLLRVPGFVEVETAESEVSNSERDEFRILVSEAFAQLAAMRTTEGSQLRLDIESRLTTIQRTTARLASERDTVIREALDFFRVRVQEIAKQAGIDVAEDRLAQETVMMVERGDIAEELTRLSIHVGEMKKLLDAPEPAGKQLDFLGQEVLREINTAGSKSRSSTIRSVVVELKTEAERIREQVQNVE